MRRIFLLAAGLGFAIALSAPAQAQAFKAACHVDKICANVSSGGGRIIKCLREHKDDLSEHCLAAIGRAMLDRPAKGDKTDPAQDPNATQNPDQAAPAQ
jgi:hypothetical protein